MTMKIGKTMPMAVHKNCILLGFASMKPHERPPELRSKQAYEEWRNKLESAEEEWIVGNHLFTPGEKSEFYLREHGWEDEGALAARYLEGALRALRVNVATCKFAGCPRHWGPCETW